MFTGIVEEVGVVESGGARLWIRCQTVLEDTAPGASIAVEGVCLTVAGLRRDAFAADVSPETLRRTTLGARGPGARVNLERALGANGRFGGHFVQGHVDGAGEFAGLEPLGAGNWWLRVRVPPELERYCVEKGSLAVNGVSLTIAALEGGLLACAIVPHTWRHTSLRFLQPGDPVNLECDILAKYVEKLLARGPRLPGLTEERLRELGY